MFNNIDNEIIKQKAINKIKEFLKNVFSIDNIGTNFELSKSSEYYIGNCILTLTAGLEPFIHEDAALKFNIYDLNYDNSKIIESILKDYNIKLKSKDYVNIYNINPIIGYNERYINDINSTNHYNENIKTIYFFQSYLDYDTSKIDLNNIQIYLTNNVTGEESLIYSN